MCSTAFRHLMRVYKACLDEDERCSSGNAFSIMGEGNDGGGEVD